MKVVLISVGLVLFTVLSSFGQNKSNIAVANPNVQGLHATPVIAAKLLRLELIKLGVYNVYDEFDMADAIKSKPEYSSNCLGMNCLISMGEELNVSYMISGSFDGLGNKIAISLKIVDVKNKSLYMSSVKEFDNQEAELQRMIEIMLKEMHGKPIEKDLEDRLKFKNELITSSNVGKINNSGPRVGYAYMTGSMNEFANRSESQGGLNIFPGVSMIGYQIEGQYVGTENFSALVEGIVNFVGMEQGVFIPSITILNGFRFGKAGWEIAFGPGFSLRRQTDGFFDTGDNFGKGADYYFSEESWDQYTYENYGTNPLYLDSYGNFLYPDPSDIADVDYSFTKHFDTRGKTQFSTTWVIGFGRTFRAGALNIPVNIFYSSITKGGMAGLSVGFNVLKKKKGINEKEN